MKKTRKRVVDHRGREDNRNSKENKMKLGSRKKWTARRSKNADLVISSDKEHWGNGRDE